MAKEKFKEWALVWVNGKKGFVKESTYANYMIAIRNHLIPLLGEYYTEDITKEIIQEIIIKLRGEGRKDGRGGLSDKTVRDMIVILKMCLKDFGIDDNRIYCKNALRYPIDDRVRKMEVMNEAMYQKTISAIRENLDYESLGYAVSLYTGMRIGEVCALQWKDIDLEQKLVSITKTLQRVYYKEGEKGRTKVIVGTPKSKASVREIPISTALEKLLSPCICEKDSYLISGNSKFIEPRLYRKHFMQFLDRNGLERIHFHNLRHTFATRCIEHGADYKTVSCILGHSSVNLTLNRYVHPQLERKRSCVELA